MKNTYKKYKVMIHNFSYLTALKGFTIVLPLITFPYLIRVLGAEKYGLVMWSWAIAQIFITIIKFGFDTLGVKLISENRDNKKKVSQIFSQITYTKLFLVLFSLIILVILLFSVDKIAENQTLFLFFMVFILCESMFPIWFFQGIEKMKILAILVSLIKLVFALLVFLLINKPEQYYYIPLLYAIGSCLSNIIAYYVIFFKHKIYLTKVEILSAYNIGKESFIILFATIGTDLRDRVTIILIEKYLGLENVAYFDLAIRIVNILLTPFHIVSSVLYPHIAKTKDILLLKKVLSSCVLISIITISIFIYNIDFIVSLINGAPNKTLSHVMSILLLIVPIGVISSFLGVNLIIVFNYTKWIAISVIIATIAYITHYATAYFTNSIDLNLFIYLFIVYFVFEMLVRICISKIILNKYKIK